MAVGRGWARESAVGRGRARESAGGAGRCDAGDGEGGGWSWEGRPGGESAGTLVSQRGKLAWGDGRARGRTAVCLCTPRARARLQYVPRSCLICTAPNSLYVLGSVEACGSEKRDVSWIGKLCTGQSLCMHVASSCDVRTATTKGARSLKLGAPRAERGSLEESTCAKGRHGRGAASAALLWGRRPSARVASLSGGTHPDARADHTPASGGPLNPTRPGCAPPSWL